MPDSLLRPSLCRREPSRGSASQGKRGKMKSVASQHCHLLMPGIIKFFSPRAHTQHDFTMEESLVVASPESSGKRGLDPRRSFSLNRRYLCSNLMMTEKYYAMQPVTCCDLGRAQPQVVGHLTLLLILLLIHLPSVEA